MRAIVAGIALMSLAACQPWHASTTSAYMPDENQATLVLFLEPSVSGPEGLDLRLVEVNAIREDGLAAPVPLALDRITGGPGDRPRLLAWGAIPEGRYTALGLRATSAASAETGGGSADEAEETRVAVTFQADANRAVVLAATLDAGPRGAVRLEPALKAGVPDPPAVGLMGLAADRGTGMVFLFDKAGGRVVRAVRVGVGPGEIAVDSGRARAYVPVEGDDSVAVIDLTGAALIGRIPLTGGDDPAAVVVTSDGNTLLSANAGSGTVSVIDARAQVETDRVRVGNAPRSLLLNAAGTRAFIFNTLSNTISVLEVPSGTVAATLSTDAAPLRGAFDRTEKRLYVIHRSSPYLGIFDPVSLSSMNRVYVGAGATALTVDPRSDRIYLARRGTRTIEIFDPFSFLPVDTIAVPGDVASLTIDREGNSLFLALPRERAVRTVRLVGKRSVFDMDFPVEPVWVALMRER